MKKPYMFSKMSGAGNDFIVFDNMGSHVKLSAREMAKLCARGKSIGADGILLIEQPKNSLAHFRMRYFNSDGGEADMCGNGARCAARFAFENRIAPKVMVFESRAGLQRAQVFANGGVRLHTPAPKVLESHCSISKGKCVRTGLFINTGVPHFVTEEKNISQLNIQAEGSWMRRHKHFGINGANINFVALNKNKSISIRTFERGVEGETLACGTGAIAAAIWATLAHKVKPPVVVHTAGGILKVHFACSNSNVSKVVLEGPTAIVLVGQLGPDALS